MDFQYSEEQRMLLDAWDRVLEHEVLPITSRYPNSYIPADQLKALLRITTQFGVGNGWVDEGQGGMGLDFVTSGLLYMALSEYSADLAGACFVNEGAAIKIAGAASPAIKEKYLEATLNGELIGCSAVSEPDIGSDVRSIRTRATRVAGGYRINGEKLWISNCSVADYVIVLAATDNKEFTMFLVDRALHGFETQEVEKLGLNGWSMGQIIFNDIFVEDEYVLGGVGSGLRETMKGFERSRCFISTLGIGLAKAALNESVEYAKERTQFSKPIAKHQLVQQLLAEMAIEYEASRLMVLNALYALDTRPGSNVEAAMAKAFATEAAVRITSKGIQIHGAFGISREFHLERYFRSARMLTIPDGTTQINNLIIGKHLTSLSAFF